MAASGSFACVCIWAKRLNLESTSGLFREPQLSLVCGLAEATFASLALRSGTDRLSRNAMLGEGVRVAPRDDEDWLDDGSLAS